MEFYSFMMNDANIFNDSPGDTSARSEKAPGTLLKGIDPSFISEKPLSLELQVCHLLDRGLSGTGEDIFFTLSKISYFHLKPYASFFTKPDGNFVSGTTITDIEGLCNFDRSFQSMLLKYIGIIEVRLRNAISFHMASTLGIFSYLDEENFHDTKRMHEMVRKYREERDRKLKIGNDAAQRLMERYSELPIWAAVEVMSFGTLSRLYGNLKDNQLQKSIVKSFLTSPKTMKGWLRTLSFIRNECAHFGVIYGREIKKESKLVNGFDDKDNRSIYHVCAIIAKLLSTDHPVYPMAFISDIENLFDIFNPNMDVLGFPDDWSDWFEAAIPEPNSVTYSFRAGHPTKVTRQTNCTYI